MTSLTSPARQNACSAGGLGLWGSAAAPIAPFLAFACFRTVTLPVPGRAGPQQVTGEAARADAYICSW